MIYCSPIPAGSVAVCATRSPAADEKRDLPVGGSATDSHVRERPQNNKSASTRAAESERSFKRSVRLGELSVVLEPVAGQFRRPTELAGYFVSSALAGRVGSLLGGGGVLYLLRGGMKLWPVQAC